MPERPDDPVVQVRHLVAEARQAFAADVDALLVAFEEWVENWDTRSPNDSGPRGESLRVIRRFVLEKFDQRLSLRSSADPVLRRLVHQAFIFLSDPDSHPNHPDRLEWTKEAKKLLQAEP